MQPGWISGLFQRISGLSSVTHFSGRFKGVSNNNKKFSSNHSPFPFASIGSFYSSKDKKEERKQSYAFPSVDYKRKWLITGTITLIYIWRKYL